MSPVKPVPDWLLERYALGELSDEERRDLERQSGSHEALRERLAELERDNLAILAAHPAEAMAREIELRHHRVEVSERIAGRGRRARNVIGLFTMLAGATAIVMLSLPPPAEITGIDPAARDDLPEVTRAKGPAQFFVHRRRAGHQEKMEDGDFARAGDLLQVSYRTPEERFAMIISIDGSGAITTHFPEGRTGGALTVGGLTELDHSYELDDATTFECFFFVTAAEPFAVQQVYEAAAILAPTLLAGETSSLLLSLPTELEQTALFFRKVSP